MILNRSLWNVQLNFFTVSARAQRRVNCPAWYAHGQSRPGGQSLCRPDDLPHHQSKESLAVPQPMIGGGEGHRGGRGIDGGGRTDRVYPVSPSAAALYLPARVSALHE